MSKQKEWLLHSKKVKEKNQIRFKVSIKYASHPKRKGVFSRETLECLSPIYTGSKSNGFFLGGVVKQQIYCLSYGGWKPKITVLIWFVPLRA